ncbi:hypothetical protein Nepgr_015789 [Nepenthes gracilis]|uniref:Uncharacterized protein n=1 Tax=Nepenthes gracilis TaxID=150966 RepID=A0AAD3XR09_NEPGR|nr:hypothetical protein Nepgr_015789 [Nepenthes gracilis]
MINIRRSPADGATTQHRLSAIQKSGDALTKNPYRYNNAPLIKPIPANCIRRNQGKKQQLAISSTRHLQDIIQNSHHHQKHQHQKVAPRVKGPKFKVSISWTTSGRQQVSNIHQQNQRPAAERRLCANSNNTTTELLTTAKSLTKSRRANPLIIQSKKHANSACNSTKAGFGFSAGQLHAASKAQSLTASTPFNCPCFRKKQPTCKKSALHISTQNHNEFKQNKQKLLLSASLIINRHPPPMHPRQLGYGNQACTEAIGRGIISAGTASAKRQDSSSIATSYASALKDRLEFKSKVSNRLLFTAVETISGSNL